MGVLSANTGSQEKSLIKSTSARCTTQTQHVVNAWKDTSFKTAYNCHKIEPIPNCRDYDHSADIETCTECRKEFVLLGPDCIERNLFPIDKCREYTPDMESCLECESLEQFALINGLCY